MATARCLKNKGELETLEDLFKEEGSSVILRATMVRDGEITEGFGYLRDYA